MKKRRAAALKKARIAENTTPIKTMAEVRRELTKLGKGQVLGRRKELLQNQIRLRVQVHNFKYPDPRPTWLQKNNDELQNTLERMITYDSEINRQFPSEAPVTIWKEIDPLGWRNTDGDEQELKNQEAGRKFCGEGESNNHYMALVEEFVDKIFFEKDEGRRYRGKQLGRYEKLLILDIETRRT